MSVWFGWPPGNDETFNIKASEVNMNINTGNIFNGSITTTFKQSNFLDPCISTFRDTATFTINPFDEKHATEEEEDDETSKDFQKELVEKLNDREFQAASRQRYKILAGITNVKPKIINTANFPTDEPEWIEDDSILQCDSIVINPTVRAGKTIKTLTQELQYDLERERDVNRRADLIMQCSRYIRLERMSDSLNDLT